MVRGFKNPKVTVQNWLDEKPAHEKASDLYHGLNTLRFLSGLVSPTKGKAGVNFMLPVAIIGVMEAVSAGKFPQMNLSIINKITSRKEALLKLNQLKELNLDEVEDIVSKVDTMQEAFNKLSKDIYYSARLDIKYASGYVTRKVKEYSFSNGFVDAKLVNEKLPRGMEEYKDFMINYATTDNNYTEEEIQIIEDLYSNYQKKMSVIHRTIYELNESKDKTEHPDEISLKNNIHIFVRLNQELNKLRKKEISIMAMARDHLGENRARLFGGDEKIGSKLSWEQYVRNLEQGKISTGIYNFYKTSLNISRRHNNPGGIMGSKSSRTRESTFLLGDVESSIEYTEGEKDFMVQEDLVAYKEFVSHVEEIEKLMKDIEGEKGPLTRLRNLNETPVDTFFKDLFEITNRAGTQIQKALTIRTVKNEKDKKKLVMPYRAETFGLLHFIAGASMIAAGAQMDVESQQIGGLIYSLASAQYLFASDGVTEEKAKKGNFYNATSSVVSGGGILNKFITSLSKAVPDKIAESLPDKFFNTAAKAIIKEQKFKKDVKGLGLEMSMTPKAQGLLLAMGASLTNLMAVTEITDKPVYSSLVTGAAVLATAVNGLFIKELVAVSALKIEIPER
jgi:hypothetical protein